MTWPSISWRRNEQAIRRPPRDSEILNLIGYGLAKFEADLVAALGFETKSELFRHLIDRGVAATVGTLKNRQDLFNPLVRQAKVGWWQNQDRYLHRKLLLDSLFGELDANGYGALFGNLLATLLPPRGGKPRRPSYPCQEQVSPTPRNRGEAELFFMNHYRTIEQFKDGVLEDANCSATGTISRSQSPIRISSSMCRGYEKRLAGFASRKRSTTVQQNTRMHIAWPS